MDDVTLLAQLEAAPWRFAKSMPEIPHWYVLRHQAPELVQAVVGAITLRGYDRKFSGRTYRYVELGGFKYWFIPPVLNREPVPPPPPAPET